jgi:hypothetical protein
MRGTDSLGCFRCPWTSSVLEVEGGIVIVAEDIRWNEDLFTGEVKERERERESVEAQEQRKKRKAKQNSNEEEIGSLYNLQEVGRANKASTLAPRLQGNLPQKVDSLFSGLETIRVSLAFATAHHAQ